MKHRQFIAIELPPEMSPYDFLATYIDLETNTELELKGIAFCEDSQAGKLVAEAIDDDNHPDGFTVDDSSIEIQMHNT